MATLILHLGSNIGNRQAHLDAAIVRIKEKLGTLSKQSSIYETAVWLGEQKEALEEELKQQAPFLNIALQIETNLPPQEALESCLDIENQLGRVRRIKWGARNIDIDLIFYDDRIIHTPQLIIPHPLMPFRRFVLLPLAEIIPEWVHPVLAKTVKELLDDCEDTGEVVRL